MTTTNSGKINETQRDEYTDNIMRLAGTESGASFFRRMFEDCGLFSVSFTGNSSSFFNDGRRSIALDIFNRIREQDPVVAIALIGTKFAFIEPKPVR